jgi:hypothetical protein
MGDIGVRLSNQLAELDRLAEEVESFGERNAFPERSSIRCVWSLTNF